MMPQAENTWLRSDLYQYHRQSSQKCEYEIKKKRYKQKYLEFKVIWFIDVDDLLILK